MSAHGCMSPGLESGLSSGEGHVAETPASGAGCLPGASWRNGQDSKAWGRSSLRTWLCALCGPTAFSLSGPETLEAGAAVQALTAGNQQGCWCPPLSRDQDQRKGWRLQDKPWGRHGDTCTDLSPGSGIVDFCFPHLFHYFSKYRHLNNQKKIYSHFRSHTA